MIKTFWFFLFSPLIQQACHPCEGLCISMGFMPAAGHKKSGPDRCQIHYIILSLN